MVVKMSAPGRSFGGVAGLLPARSAGAWGGGSEEFGAGGVDRDPHWRRARTEGARIMAATAEAGPELKRLSGVVATGAAS